MKLFNFGYYIAGKSYRVMDERVMRGSGALMFLLGVLAFFYGVVMKHYAVLPYLSGFMMLNFFIGIVINPMYSPTIVLAKYMVRKQTPLHVGAVQKHFAWSMGFGLSTAIFVVSLLLQNNEAHLLTVAIMCLVCLTLIFFEMGFGICIGCKIYFALLKAKVIPEPQERPNCIGDSCDYTI